jgi:hypothetical protein
MNTMTMPGFTAEASLYSKGGFDEATVTVSQNTTERVQPCHEVQLFYSWSSVQRRSLC